MSERTVGLVGLGVIGGSLARALVAGGVRVLGTARDARDGGQALRSGVEVVADAAALATAMPAAGVVVLAIPLPALAHTARALLARLAPDVTVLHAASLQRPAATGLAGDPWARVVGTHPMAGSHDVGFAASRADLFVGATVWAESRADDAARAALEWMWDRAGARRVEYRDAEAHDAQMAWVSHLPQLTATALAATLADSTLRFTLGGPGLRDTTRLAASPLPLWRDLLRAAPAETDAALARMADTIAELRVALAGGDAAALAAVWERARAWRTGQDAPVEASVAAPPASSAPADHPRAEDPMIDANACTMGGAARW